MMRLLRSLRSSPEQHRLRPSVRGVALTGLGALVLGTIGLGTIGLGPTAAHAEPRPAASDPASCTGPYAIDKTMANGARWQMCWEIRRLPGLVLTKVIYTPRGGTPTEVLSRASLAELHVPYDTGEPRYFDLSGIGFGGESLTALTPRECPNGELRSNNGKQVLCITDQPRGYAYKDAAANTSLQGHDLVIFSVSELGWYDYITEWRFGDDGTITPREGASGSLSPGDFTNAATGWPIGVGSDRFSENHSHNVFWRIDFDVNGQTSNRVEQYDFSGSGTAKRVLKRTVLAKETAADLAPMRWWRVENPAALNADRHPMSWEIDAHDSDQYRGPAHTEDFTHHDVYVTQYRLCEELATGNTGPGCAASVDKYVNAETITDPVLWVNVDFHHVPRDEDEDPMPTHWQGFKIIPRDVSAKSPLP
jgi:primary-amine oxidase